MATFIMPESQVVSEHENVVGISCTEDDIMNPEWLGAKLNQPVSSVVAESLSSAGGLSAVMKRIVVTNDECRRTFVLKTMAASEFSKNVGLYREAYFFKLFSGAFPTGFLPKVYIVHGNANTGRKLILFEDLAPAIQTGYFFGPGSPLNWGKDLDSIISLAPLVSVADILNEVAILAGKMHSKFWMRPDLLSNNWLRGSKWQSGANESEWVNGQNSIRSMWHATKAKIGNIDYGVSWDSKLVNIIDSSMAKVSWIDFQSRIQSESWTLVHGDFHPANMMWRTTTDQEAAHSSPLVILDWEVVGLGSGAQDLGQYMISHTSPEKRRECEDSFLRTYYIELTKTVSETEYTWTKCRQDYIAGGSERWIWLLVYLTTLCPAKMVQYFHDQVGAFLFDHNVTPDSVGMPRL